MFKSLRTLNPCLYTKEFSCPIDFINEELQGESGTIATNKEVNSARHVDTGGRHLES